MKNLDSKIKEAFEQKESQLDKFDLWQEIEKELPENKKDRKFFFWIFFGGISIATIGILLSIYFGNPTEENNSLRKVTEMTTETKDKKVKTNHHSATSLDTIKKIIKKIDLVKNKEVINSIDETLTKNSKKNTNTPKITFNQQEPANKIHHKKTTFTNTESAPNLTTKKSDSPLLRENLANENLTGHSPILKAFVGIPFLETLGPPLLNSEKRKDAPIVINKMKTTKWSAKLGTSFLLLERSFSGIDAEYIEEKTASEAFRYAYQADGLIFYEPIEKFSIGIGLDYTVLEEVINWTGVIDNNATEVQNDSASFFEYVTTTFYVPGTSTQYEITTRNLRNYNRIQQWSIPIELNFVPLQSARFSLHLTAGAKFNFANKVEGKFLGLSDEIKEEDEVYDLYKKSGVHQWYAGLGMEYKLTQKLSFLTNFRSQRSSNILQPLAGTKLRYRGFSIGVGIRKKF